MVKGFQLWIIFTKKLVPDAWRATKYSSIYSSDSRDNRKCFFPVFAFTVQWNLYKADTNGAKKVLTL